MNLYHARLKWAGAIGVLCECSVAIGNGAEKEDLRVAIQDAIDDWCKETGWTWRRTLHRIDVFPPKEKGGGHGDTATDS